VKNVCPSASNDSPSSSTHSFTRIIFRGPVPFNFGSRHNSRVSLT
jgi:hypothetical protein